MVFDRQYSSTVFSQNQSPGSFCSPAGLLAHSGQCETFFIETCFKVSIQGLAEAGVLLSTFSSSL